MKISPTRFTKLLSKNRLSEGKGLQGGFGVGTIEWEQQKRLLSIDNLICMVLRGFDVTPFNRLHRVIVDR